ncbi:unnamed protein product [Knipowitschia caucasica]|uniref:Uncharacterized protein n=1 Tax=Knipowitschia caucasica TaxID=637954 RepID=A0AAV2J796_KNICA
MPELVREGTGLSDSTSEEQSLSSYTSESFDDNASIVTVIRLVNDAVNNIESEVSNMDKEPQRNSPASHWESSSQSASWLSPSRLRPPETTSPYNLDDTQSIKRGGSTRSLQLDYRVMSFGSGGDRGRTRGSGKRMFQWERNQSGEWERKRVLDHETHNLDLASYNDSPVYEEYTETSPGDTDGLYDTLPPTRPAYEGYPSSPPGLNLHPAQLLPPLRAWDLQTEQWRQSSQEEEVEVTAATLTGTGDELEKLLNLVSLRARRATRINRASTGSEPSSGWDSYH